MPRNFLGSSRSLLPAGCCFLLAFLSCLFFFPSKVFASPGTDSMLGYWKFDGSVADSSGDGSTAILSGSTLPNYSMNAPGLSFSSSNSLNFFGGGSSSYVNFSNQSNLKPSSALTFSTWIYLNAFPSGTTKFAGNFSADSNGGFYFAIDAANVYFYIGNTPVHVSFPISGNLPVGTWKQLTATWDGTTVKLFLNGTNMGSASFTGLLNYSGTNFQLGNVTTGSFNGKLDDVRLYNRALNPATEISDLALGKHTAASWIGNYSQNYEDYQNWNINEVPDPYTLVNIATTGPYNPYFTVPESMAGLRILSGAFLNLQSYNFTMNDGGVFSSDGTLKLENTATQTITDFFNDINSGTVQIIGSASATGLETGSQYYNLAMNSTGTITLNSNLTVNNHFFLQNGAIDASTGNFWVNVKGNWEKGGGNFIPRNGTVYLAGTNQLVSGSNTFYNLSKITGIDDTLSFQASATQTILGTLTLQGSSSHYLSLRSSTSGTQWKIDPQGTRIVSGLDVKDSNNLNSGKIILSGLNIDSGNNLNWEFDATSPAISIDPAPSPVASHRPRITGVATESNVNVASVSFQADSTSGSWDDCTANDGSFDSQTEIFSCKPESDLPDGRHTYYVRSEDENGVFTPSNNYASVSLTIDTKPPDISSVSHDPGADSAKIKWHTDENSTSRVEYGKTSSYGKANSSNEKVKDHSMTVSSLDKCTEYHYRVKSKDLAGNEDKSADRVFKTTGCVPVSSASSSTAEETTTTSVSSETNSETSAQTNTGTSNTSSTSPATANFNGSTTDDWQVKYFGNPFCLNINKCGAKADPDGDGIPNVEEFRLGTNPLSADSDKDGAPDSVEIESGHDPTVSAQKESDAITYENPEENGEVKKEIYEVKNVEVVEEGGQKKVKVSGKGPPNAYVTVFIYSDPIVLTIKTDSDGNWSYMLDKDLADGQHEVYVAVTDNTGKISEKSEPLAFVKTAEAVTVIPPVEAAAEERAASPTEVWYKSGIFLYSIIAGLGLVFALGSIGVYKHRSGKKIENAETENLPVEPNQQ